MGICKYCGKDAGYWILSHAHSECEKRHDNACDSLKKCINDVLFKDEDVSILVTAINESKGDFVSIDEIAQISSDALSRYADSLPEQVSKQHMIKIDSFINNIGVPVMLLDANGAVSKLRSRLENSVLISYFTSGSTISKIQSKQSTIENLLPVSGFNRQEAAMDVLNKYANQYLTNGFISDQDKKTIEAFLNASGISFSSLVPAQPGSGSAMEKIAQAIILKDLHNGRLPNNHGAGLPIILGRDEVVIWTYSNVTMFNEKIQKELVGRHGGFSIPIYKGIRYRVGSSKGKMQESSQMVNEGTGYLVLTNKNIIFYSSSKSAKVPYTKLVGITPYTDGIELLKEGENAKRQVFQGFDGTFTVNVMSILNQ